METHDQGDRLTPDEARDALISADAEESATRNRPVPAWYFPALAALVLALFLLNMIDEPTGAVRAVAIGVVLLVAIAVAVLVGRVSFAPNGYHGVRIAWGPTLAWAAVAAALAVTPVLIAGVVGTWIWAACGAALALIIGAGGAAYQRRTRG